MNKKTISSESSRTRSEKNLPAPQVDTGENVECRRIAAKVTKTARSTRTCAVAVNENARRIEAAVVRFVSGDRSIDFNIDITRDTVWATQQQIADLFGTDQATIGFHIDAIFATGELDREASTASFSIVGQDCVQRGCYEIEHFDLDIIVAIGHKMNSAQAIAFRKWANAILRSYLTRGYALNERRLRDDPAAASSLAERLRAIRAEEQHIFAKVRDYFKAASTDYDGSTEACRRFYMLLQDKFHYAASGMTACQLILARADHRSPSMGLTTFDGVRPTADEARVGKNYLSADELHVLRIVSEQFLLYVESKAIRGKAMTMMELAAKFDELLRVNGYDVFVGWEKDFLRPKADRHVQAEYARFLVRQRSTKQSSSTI